MKTLLKRLAKSQMVQVSLWNLLAVFIKMLTGLVSVKVVAVIIGPSGVALLGQLSNFSSILMTASTGGINSGVVKYVAENKEKKAAVAPFLRTGLKVVLILSLLIGIILIAGSTYWSSLILKTPAYKLVFLIFGLTIILYALNMFLVSVINGYKEFKKYVVVNISGSVIGLILSVVLVLLWNIEGALIATVTYQSIVFFITLYLVYKSSWFSKELFFGKFDVKSAKKLSHYSLMALTSALTVPISQLFVRDFIISNMSLNDAGIWEGINRISIMYLTVITTSFGVYYLPRLSELQDRFLLRNEIFKAYKLFIPLLLICSLSLFFLKDVIIKLLFSSDFYGMRDLFKFQLIGDFFKIGSWLLAYNMLAKSMTKTYITTEILFSLSFVLLSFFLLPSFGVMGATIAYAVNYFVYFVVMMVIFRKLLFEK